MFSPGPLKNFLPCESPLRISPIGGPPFPSVPLAGPNPRRVFPRTQRVQNTPPSSGLRFRPGDPSRKTPGAPPAKTRRARNPGPFPCHWKPPNANPGACLAPVKTPATPEVWKCDRREDYDRHRMSQIFWPATALSAAGRPCLVEGAYCCCSREQCD